MEHPYGAIRIQVRPDVIAARLAAHQHGVFARDQLTRLGVTRGVIQHRMRMGRWERMAPSVLRLAGSPPTWRQSLMVACLTWGEGATVSHRAAAALWSLAGCEPGPIELTVPRSRHHRKRPATVHRNQLRPSDATVKEAIPLTTPTRTLIDLAAVASRDATEEALDDALRRRIVSIPRVRRRLDEIARPGRPGIRVLRALLDAREDDGVPQSVFETRLLRTLNRAALPKPVLQHPIRDGARLIAVVDFAFPSKLIAIEAEGYRWHSGLTGWESDRARRNRITALGWRVIHVTWAELVNKPDAVIHSIRRTLGIM